MAEAGVLRQDRRYELLDGYLLEMHMSGQGHQTLVRRLHRLLDRRLTEHGIDSEDYLLQGEALYFSETRYVAPDLVLMREPVVRPGTVLDPRAIRAEANNALLVYEVSTSTYQHDAGRKLRDYAQVGIPHYWIASAQDWPNRVLEVYQAPRGDTYRSKQTYGQGDVLLVEFPGLSAKPSQRVTLGPLAVDALLRFDDFPPPASP